jgi:hypothetical protein
VVCDTIIEDRLTGKKTLVGLHDQIFAKQLPCRHPELDILVTLTSGLGNYPCEVICRHADMETMLFSAKGNVELRDPSTVTDMVFRLYGLKFTKPGTYWLQFLIDGIPLMTRPLKVSKVNPAEKQD